MTETRLKKADELEAACKKRMAANPKYLRFVTAKSGPGIECKTVFDARQELIYEMIQQFNEQNIRPLRKRLELLEAELSEARELKYCGVWTTAVYLKGNFCTHSGSLWVAKQGTDTRPGTDDTWQLCAKGGK